MYNVVVVVKYYGWLVSVGQLRLHTIVICNNVHYTGDSF